MAKKKKSKSRENPLQGIIVRAEGGINQIAAHTFPEIDTDCFIIQAKDIIGNNRIEILKEAFPLLNSSIITYIGQPLLLILAPSLEKAESIKDSIVTTYISVEKESPLKEPNIIPYNFGDFEGELKKVTDTRIAETKDIDESNEFEDSENSLEGSNLEKEEPKKGSLLNFSSKMHLKRQQTENNPIYKVFSELNDDVLDIYVPTQWPSLIQDNIASTCGIKKNKIIVHKEFNFSPKDEKVIQPAVLSALAAVGTLLTQKNVEIYSVYPTFKCDALIKRITWIDDDNNLIAEEIDVTIDQGAYPLFSKEMTRQYLAGLMPLYKVKALKVIFTITASNNPPSNFYDGLGYINAIASSQIHSTKLGKHLGYSPFLWREYNLKENEIQSQIVTLSNMAEQKALLETLEEESYFNRKYAAYKVTKSLKTKLSTFSPYARGIGLSIAPGISGFSNYFNELPKQALGLTLDVGGKVDDKTSYSNKSKSSKIWTKMISEELDVDEKGISFTEEGPDIKDSGPSVLARNSGNMADLIKKACTLITEKRFIQGLPIEITSEIEKQTLKQGTPYFNSTTWTASVVELRIDPITLDPIVFNVTLFCSLGAVVNENEYIAKIKHSVISTLIEAGAKLASGEYFNIDIKLNHLSDNFTDSVSSVLKGTILASFTSALDMALNEDIEVLPTSSEDLLELIKDKI